MVGKLIAVSQWKYGKLNRRVATKQVGSGKLVGTVALQVELISKKSSIPTVKRKQVVPIFAFATDSSFPKGWRRGLPADFKQQGKGQLQTRQCLTQPGEAARLQFDKLKQNIS